jgi:LmbE family N-acetylglucosaminyl deacetylase
MFKKNGKVILITSGFVFFCVSTFLLVQFVTRPIYIFLSPHLDDAVLSAGGLILEKTEPKLVVTFFAGEPSQNVKKHWDTISGFKNSSIAMTKRKIENEKALKILGSDFTNLDNLDFQYRKELKSISNENLTQKIKDQISDILKSYKYRNIYIYGPSTFGKHITHLDHQILHDAFAFIAKSTQGKNIHFFLYEDFPYTLRFQRGSDISLKKFIENHDGLKLSQLEFELSSTSVSTKTEAIKSYDSQNTAFMNLNEDIISESELFMHTRCAETLKKPCEVYYSIEH